MPCQAVFVYSAGCEFDQPVDFPVCLPREHQPEEALPADEGLAEQRDEQGPADIFQFRASGIPASSRTTASHSVFSVPGRGCT